MMKKLYFMALLLTACAPADQTKTGAVEVWEPHNNETWFRIKDDTTVTPTVRCYIYRSYGMSCLPVQLKTEYQP